MTATFVQVTSLDQLAPGTGTAVSFAGDDIALFNVDGRVFAIDDLCMRCGASLAAGTLLGLDVTCSGCDWRYDVSTGNVVGVPGLRADRFQVTIVDSKILLSGPRGLAL